MTDLRRQIEFLMEIDKLKSVARRVYLADGSRRENSAEHSWHAAVAARLLAEYADEPVDVEHVVGMLLVHDIVEVDAGDTFIYAAADVATQAQREREAAKRLFGMLPVEQGERLRALWEEFERRDTPEARFAAAVDRLLPVLHNCWTQGRVWREHGVTAGQVFDRIATIGCASRRLVDFVHELVNEAIEKGHLRR